MKYHYLTPAGDPVHKFIFFDASDPARPATVRSRYADLQCPVCGKLDEYAALDRGIDPDVVLKSKKDFIWTFDFCYAVSDRFREVYERQGLQGLKFVPVSRSPHSVVRPTVVVPTDLARSRLKLIGEPCRACGRYRESLFAPFMESMTPPADPLVIFSPSERAEKGEVRMCDLLVSEVVMEILHQHKITGVDWISTKRVAS